MLFGARDLMSKQKGKKGDDQMKLKKKKKFLRKSGNVGWWGGVDKQELI